MTRDKIQFLSPLFLKYQSDFEKNPRSRVFAPLAESYRKVGMTEKAMEVLSQGIRFNPNYVMGYLGLAFCYYDLKQFNLAYSTLRPIVDSNRDNIRLQRLFADCCTELGHKEEALDTLKYLLFINPRDKEVAKLVLLLEKDVEEKYHVEHKPIIIPVENFSNEEEKSPTLFEINRLSSTLVVDFDDWLQIDLKQKERSEPATISKIESWNVKNISSNKIEEAEKTISTKTLSNFESKEDEEPKVQIFYQKESAADAPIVTHTLVDLYCGQGHIEKALEILEKILQLNPNDEKTIEKIKEIKSLMNFEESTYEVIPEEVKPEYIEKDITKTGLELVNLEDVNNVSEEDGRRQLMNILEEKVFSSEVIDELDHIKSSENEKIQKIEEKLSTFLKKIHQRALDYQNRI